MRCDDAGRRWLVLDDTSRPKRVAPSLSAAAPSAAARSAAPSAAAPIVGAVRKGLPGDADAANARAPLRAFSGEEKAITASSLSSTHTRGVVACACC